MALFLLRTCRRGRSHRENAPQNCEKAQHAERIHGGSASAADASFAAVIRWLQP